MSTWFKWYHNLLAFGRIVHSSLVYIPGGSTELFRPGIFSLLEYGISNMYMVLAHQPAGSMALYAIMSVCMASELLITSLRYHFSGICMKVIIRMVFKNSFRTSYVFFWFTTIHVSVITYSNCTSFVGKCRRDVLFSTSPPCVIRLLYLYHSPKSVFHWLLTVGVCHWFEAQGFCGTSNNMYFEYMYCCLYTENWSHIQVVHVLVRFSTYHYSRTLLLWLLCYCINTMTCTQTCRIAADEIRNNLFGQRLPSDRFHIFSQFCIHIVHTRSTTWNLHVRRADVSDNYGGTPDIHESR